MPRLRALNQLGRSRRSGLAVGGLAAGSAPDLPYLYDFTTRPDGSVGGGWVNTSSHIPEYFEPLEIASGALTGEAGVRGMITRIFPPAGGYKVSMTADPVSGAFGQVGPIAHFTHQGAGHIGMAMYFNVIFARYYLVAVTDSSRVIYDSNQVATVDPDVDSLVELELRSVGGQIAGYLEGNRFLGPVTIPVDLASSRRHGVYSPLVAGAGAYSIGVDEYEGSLPAYTAPTIPVAPSTPVKANSTSVSPNYPSGVQAGEALIAIVAGNAGGSWSSSGWTKVSQSGNIAGLQTAIFRRTAVGGETGSVTFTKSGGSSSTCVGTIFRVGNWNTKGDANSPVASQDIRAATSGTTMTSPSGDPGGMHRTGVWVGSATGSSPTITPPAGYTQIIHSTAGTQNISLCIAAKDWDAELQPPFTAAGTVGTGTLSVSNAWNAYAFDLLPFLY